MTDPLDDILDDLFHGAALRAFLECYAQTRKFPPDSETVRKRAYQLFEEENRKTKPPPGQ